LHLCFTFSVILCVSAAYDHCHDDNLNHVLRDKLKELLRKRKAKYNCKLEEKAAYDISLYNLNDPENPEDVKKILKFMNERTVAYKAKYFKSREKLYKQMKILGKGRNVGCVHLLNQSKITHDRQNHTILTVAAYIAKYHRYICLIEKTYWWWF
ncbi:unnamed protein product, partial [Cylicocyclus nassatus]